MLTSIGAFAQWVAPEMPAKTSNLEDVVGEKVFLYNKEAGGFLRGLGESGKSPHWGTRAGVDTAGIDTIIIQKPYKSSVKEGTTQTSKVDESIYPYWFQEGVDNGDTYIIQNFTSHGPNRWDEIWFGLTDFGSVWNDRQNSVDNNNSFFWDITKSDKGYAIKASPKVPALLYLAELGSELGLVVKAHDEVTDSFLNVIKGGERLGVNLDDASKTLCFEGLDAKLAYDWTIVKVADYEAADIEGFKLDVARYSAALSLKASIDKGKADYPEADFSAAEAVYNNTASTVEELQGALELVTKAIIAYQESLATPDKPSDMSSAIVNGTFDVVGDFHGWEGSSFGAGGTTAACAERYEMNYNTYQDIKNLPLGVYAVTVKGFYRAGWAENDWATKDDPTVRHARLYAKSGTDSLTTAIPSLSAAGIDNNSLSTKEVASGTGIYVPDNMAQFVAYNEAGHINDVRVVVPVSDGTLRIGVVKTTTLTGDWTIVDDFKLMYYGKSFEAYDAWRNQAIANYPTIDQIITDDETLYSPSYRKAYEDAIAAAATETESANMGHAIAAIQPALDALYANIAAYKAYVAKANEIQDELANNTSLDAYQEDVAYLSDYFMDSSTPEDEVYPNGGYEYITSGEAELTNEQLEAELENLNNWLQAAIKNGSGTGADMTHMLVNASFKDGFTGWTSSTGGTPTGGVGGESFYPSVEVYENVVDVCQTITGVPAGIYSISCQAFERPVLPADLTGEESLKVYIYMNEVQTPVMNIITNGLPIEEAVESGEGQNCLTSNDSQFNGMYIPNGMAGASWAFAGGSASYPAGTRYLNTCYGIVGDDGVMKIGLTSNGVKAHWVLWANFKLTFEGKNEEAMTAILASTVAQAEAYLEEKVSEMTNPALTALNDAIALADDASDYESSYAALIAINSAMADAKANVDAYAKLTAAADVLYTAMSEYESTASEEALIKATEVSEKVEDASNLTTEEIIALTEEIEFATAMVKVPVTEGASDENPIDMTSVIKNADFSLGADNGDWTVEKNGGNGPKYDDSFSGAGFEFWNSSVTSLSFDMHQTLVALPEGKYAMTADLTNSYNDQTPGTDEGRVHLYATVINGTDSTTYAVAVEPQTEPATSNPKTYEVIFDMPANAMVQIGVKTVGVQAARWVVGDTFTLKYFGTESSKENSGDSTPIEGVESAEEVVPVAIYSISGTRLAAPQKGINIIKMSNGSVKKVLVK